MRAITWSLEFAALFAVLGLFFLSSPVEFVSPLFLVLAGLFVLLAIAFVLGGNCSLMILHIPEDRQEE
jgi:hypothetical protein